MFLRAKLVIEFGPPPVGMQLLAANHDARAHYGRKLGRSRSRKDSDSSSSTKSTKASKPSKKSTKASKKSSKGSGSKHSAGSDDIDDLDPGMPSLPVCPNSNIDLSTVLVADAIVDSTIVHREEDKSFGSDVLLELSPSRCGDIHTMLIFDAGPLLSGSPIEYASILVHVIEGSNLSGATFLNAPAAADLSENELTWRNAPEYDRVISSLSTIRSGTVRLPLMTCFSAVRRVDSNYPSSSLLAVV